MTAPFDGFPITSPERARQILDCLYPLTHQDDKGLILARLSGSDRSKIYWFACGQCSRCADRKDRGIYRNSNGGNL